MRFKQTVSLGQPPAALQAATISVAMASGKNIWRLKFLHKSPIGDLQIKRDLLENISKIGQI